MKEKEEEVAHGSFRNSAFPEVTLYWDIYVVLMMLNDDVISGNQISY